MMAEAAIAERLMTAEELAVLPRDGRRYELIRGRLVTMAPPGEEHGRLGSRLGSWLFVWVEEHDLGVVYSMDTGFFLGHDPDTVRAPDGAFITRSRAAAAASPRFSEVLPDLVLEVASPSDSQDALLGKVGAWLDAGVAVVWVLWPRAQCLQVWRAGHDVITLHPDDTLTCADLLPGFELPLRKVFKEAPEA